MLQFLFIARIAFLCALFLPVYKIKELKGKFGLTVSSPKLFAVFSQTGRTIFVSSSGGSSDFIHKFTAETKLFHTAGN